MYLRQSTASQEIQLGKFVDSGDGSTAETALSIANTDIKLFKHGATSQASKNSGGATHMASGHYYAVLDATDTDTLGNLEITVDVAGALSVRREFVVLPAMVFDSMILGTDVLQADVTQFGGTNGTFSGGRPEVNTTHAAGTAWGSGAITSAVIATGAVDADALAADAVTEIWAGSTAPSAATIADAVWDEDATAHQTQGTFGQAIGDPVADSDTIWGLVNTNLNATISSRASQTSLDTLDDYVDTEVASILAAVDTEIGAIKTVTDQITFGTANRVNAQVYGMEAGVVTAAAVATGAIDADALAADAVTEIWAGSTAPTAATIADAVWDEDATAHQTQGTFGQAIGDPVADSDTIWGLVNTNLNATISSRASQTSVDAVDDFLDTEVAAIKTVTDQITFGTANRVNAQVYGIENNAITAASIATNAIDADAIAADAVTEIQSGLATAASITSLDGKIDTIDNFLDTEIAALLAANIVASGTIGATGNSTTALHLDGLTYGDDEINDYLLVIRDISEGEYHTRWIDDWTATGDLATVATLPFTPQASTDTYTILPVRRDALTAANVWAAASRTLTALDEDNTTLDLDATIRAAMGLAAANLDTQLDALPTAAENTTAVWAAGTRSLTVLDEDSTTLDLDATIRSAVGLASANLDTQLDALPTAVENADQVLSRNVSNVEATMGEHTLGTIILAVLEHSISGTTWTIKRTNGTTTHATKTLTVEANADSVTGVA